MSEACIQAVRIKLSRTSYEQLNKPVYSYKEYNFVLPKLNTE